MILLALLILLLQTLSLPFRQQSFFNSFPIRGDFLDAKLACEGTIVSEVITKKEIMRFDVGFQRCQNMEHPLSNKIRLYVKNAGETFTLGESIKFTAHFREPHDFQNPGGFSYRRFLASQSIGATAFLADPPEILKPFSAPDLNWLTRMRRELLQAIDVHVSGQEGALLKAILLGAAYDLDDDVRDDFSLAGTAHLLAISGLHVLFMAMLGSWMLGIALRRFSRLFLLMPRQKIVAIAVLPLIWGYLALAAFPVSGVRAGIMATLYYAAKLLNRRPDALSILSASAVIIMWLWPYAVVDVSFQLSASAVLGLILFTKPLTDWLTKYLRVSKRERWLQTSVITPLAVSIAATVITAPLIAYYFHVLSLAGIATNLLAVPFTGFLLTPLAALSAASSWMGLDLPWLWKLAEYAAQGLLEFSRLVAAGVRPLVFHLAPAVTVVGMIYVSLFLFARRKWRSSCLVGMLAVAFFVYPTFRPWLWGQLEMTFLDVGQGDAALLRFPNGKNWMIDAGGLRGSSFDVGEKIIAPALWRSGVYSLDRLVISHPHVDHFSGAMSLVELFSPRAFVSSGVAPSEEDDVLWRELLKLLLQKHIKQEMIAVPYPSWQEGEISIRLLHPPEYDVRFLDPNEGSLVLSIQYQDVRALFMGDGGLLAEAMLKKSIDRHDILKVGHHGSRTSTGWEFLAEVDPRIAIVSVGAQNRYGLPDEEVLKRLSRHGVEVYRTDQDGAVTITTDGNRIKSKLSSPSVLIGDLM